MDTAFVSLEASNKLGVHNPDFSLTLHRMKETQLTSEERLVLDVSGSFCFTSPTSKLTFGAHKLCLQTRALFTVKWSYWLDSLWNRVANTEVRFFEFDDRDIYLNISLHQPPETQFNILFWSRSFTIKDQLKTAP